MEHIEKLMKHYDMAVDELMDANKYAKLFWDAEDSDERTMYKDLVKQEIGHANGFIRESEKAASGDQDLLKVWGYLSRRLERWKLDLEKMLS